MLAGSQLQSGDFGNTYLPVCHGFGPRALMLRTHHKYSTAERMCKGVVGSSWVQTLSFCHLFTHGGFSGEVELLREESSKSGNVTL